MSSDTKVLFTVNSSDKSKGINGATRTLMATAYSANGIADALLPVKEHLHIHDTYILNSTS